MDILEYDSYVYTVCYFQHESTTSVTTTLSDYCDGTPINIGCNRCFFRNIRNGNKSLCDYLLSTNTTSPVFEGIIMNLILNKIKEYQVYVKRQ